MSGRATANTILLPPLSRRSRPRVKDALICCPAQHMPVCETKSKLSNKFRTLALAGHPFRHPKTRKPRTGSHIAGP